MEEAAKVSIDAQESLRAIRIHWLNHAVHSMRGPLFAARGYTKLLIDGKGGELTVTQQRYLETTLENIDKIAASVDRLQDFKDQDGLCLELLDLSTIVGEEMNRWGEQEKTLRLNRHIFPGAALSVGDRAKLSSSVHKLLSAIVEFSRPDGKIDLYARREGDEFLMRMTAARNGTEVQGESANSLELEGACQILRLHGGVASADCRHPGIFNITVRLPLVGPDVFES